MALGFLATAAGIAGIVLPLVPTTPFILAAAFAFARSSPRLEQWILSHATFGPMIENWRKYGSIAPRAKRLAIALMLGALGLSIALRLPLWLLAIQGLVLVAVAAFLLTRPDGPPKGEE